MASILARFARGIAVIALAAPLFARGTIVPERKKVPCTDATASVRPGWTAAVFARIGWGAPTMSTCAPEPPEPPNQRSQPHRSPAPRPSSRR